MNQIPIFKLITLGKPNAGKTSLIDYYVHGPNYETPPLGNSYRLKKEAINNSFLKLEIWDTCGQEKFRILPKIYYKNAGVAIFIYDITDYDSFKKINFWQKELIRNINDNIPLFLIGNKSDLPNRKVTYGMGFSLAKKYGLIFNETSSKNGTNIGYVFHNIASTLMMDFKGKGINGSLQEDNED